MKKTILISLLVMILCVGIAFAGFGSTSLPKNDNTGMRELRIPLGEVGSVHIYPSNQENNSIYFMIEITAGEEYLVNKLEESYEIPPYSESDDYDIEMAFKLPRNATEGNKYRIAYKITSTTSDPKGEGMVGIAPAGFIKRFDMVVLEQEKKPFNIIWFYIGLGAITISVILLITLVKRHNKDKKNQQEISETSEIEETQEEQV